MYNKHGGINQQWDIVYADEWKGEPGKGEFNERFGMYVERDFNIVSRLPRSRFLDLVSNKFVIKTPNGFKSQVWYFDQRSLTIRSRSAHKSWDIQNSGRNKEMQVWNTNSQWWQLFKYQNSMFINWKNGKALDVSGGKDNEGQPVIAWNKHGGINQKWTIRYLDTQTGKGPDGLNKDFGFVHNKPFYIVSRMAMNRVIEWPGGGHIRIQNWVENKKSQQFWWDGISKTIKSNNWKQYSLNIQSSGSSQNVSMTTTNARWF